MALAAGVREERAEARRQTLIDAARALFVNQGFHQTGMAQLAAVSGIKMGQIYRDFGSKDDIIAAICEQDISMLLSDVKLFDDQTARGPQALRAWIEDYVTHQPGLDQCRILTEIVAEAGRNSRVAQILVDLETRLQAKFDSVFSALTNGQVDQDDRMRLIRIMMALNMGLMMQKAVQPHYDAVATTRAAMDLILRELELMIQAPRPGQKRVAV
ncbi:MAG: TetR/AcrR family transcriptional regulator [Brevundimonas sp.]|jgi:AcrR family transcriptional regulator